MRSRDLRTFTVEIKNKRRHAATPPASLWADAEAALLKPVAVPNGFGAGEPIEVRRGPSAGSAKADQPRRVLPDLRPAEPEPSAGEESGRNLRLADAGDGAGAAPPGRPSRRGRSAAPQGAEPRQKRGPRRSERPAVAPGLNANAADTRSADAAFAGSAFIVAAAEVPVDGIALSGQAPMIVVPAGAERPARRWARRVEDLPRGERWKRRLPEVCR
jgi:hypothetical protein